MNRPKLLDVPDELGTENPIVCAIIHKTGFRMRGGIPAYEQAIAQRRIRPVATSVLASGAIAPQEAVAYTCAGSRASNPSCSARRRAPISATPGSSSTR